MYVYLGTNFNFLHDIFMVGGIIGFLSCLMLIYYNKFFSYMYERTTFYIEKRKELKRERKNRKNC